jgi:hypothetical protein
VAEGFGRDVGGATERIGCAAAGIDVEVVERGTMAGWRCVFAFAALVSAKWRAR